MSLSLAMGLPEPDLATSTAQTVLAGAEKSGYHRDTNFTMADPHYPAAELPLGSTVELLSRARAGDADAVDQLFQRTLPALRRWARGRLPAGARGALDTQDLVQDTLLKALRHLDRFESRHDGAFQAYLRQAVLNRITDEVRRVARRPAPASVDEGLPSGEASPLDIAIGRQGVARYEAALRQLRPADREAIIGRLELQHEYEELAVILGKPTANAARVAVTRALERLLEQLDHEA